MKICLSAYACEPARGSEMGIGWNWALTLAEMGHEVLVVTRAARGKAEAIDAAVGDLPEAVRQRLRFIYYDFQPGGYADSKKQRMKQLRYILWQRRIKKIVAPILAEESFDLVHHITFGSTRFGSKLDGLGIPFVFGPVGGVEHAPRSLRENYSFNARISETLRDISNGLIAFSPAVRRTIRKSLVAAAKTPETLEVLKRYNPDASLIAPEIGVRITPDRPRTTWGSAQARDQPGRRVKLIFAGRLLHWKGLNVAIAAFAKAREERNDIDFTIVGVGPERGRLRELAEDLKVADKIAWVDWLPQEELFARFAEHDALFFTSLHDSSGNVILESMEQGLPVVCLKLGGPGVIVNDRTGWSIDTDGKSYEQVTWEVAQVLVDLARDPEQLERKGAAAQAEAREQTWSYVVKALYDVIAAKLPTKVL